MRVFKKMVVLGALFAIGPGVTVFAQTPADTIVEDPMAVKKEQRYACARVEMLTYVIKEKVVNPMAVRMYFYAQCKAKGGVLNDDFAVTPLPDGISTSYSATCTIDCPGNRFILPRMR